MNRYVLYRDRNNHWRWRFVHANGNTIADSAEGYWNKSDAINGISIMKASYGAPVVEV